MSSGVGEWTTSAAPASHSTGGHPSRCQAQFSALTGYAYGVTVPADSQFKTWQDVAAYAKQNPGKVNFGSPGAASTPHIGMERIQKHLGIKLVHVPFKGSAEVNVAVAGGHVMVGASGTSAKVLADAGKLRFLNIWTPERLKTLPDVPTLRELGIPFDIEGPIGLAGPKGMPPEIIRIWEQAAPLILADPEYKAMYTRDNLAPNFLPHAEYGPFVEQFAAETTAYLKSTGVIR